ncbi:UPF0481 protein [Camellia lanceoleosa]|uniref:UPF0481 protein n=1 Tax=Camellia lanceoleosa TaxID=1840588 RepID=A0ACC0G849_9ERIC|nr:UPF0481 protein [Camellia lanceoleosa]
MSAPSCDSELSVVIHSPPNPQPQQPQPQPNNVWLSSIMNVEIGSGESSMPKHKIQKVPQMLLQVGTESTKKCYEPQLVSIGPYHHENTNLKPFEKFKFQFTKEYVNSCGSYSINDLYDKVADVAIEARNCYAEGTNIDDTNDTDFTRMMFLDGCFILQYIHYMTHKNEQAKMKMKNHDKAFVERDLFLLENQLPFKVLRALMTMNSEFAGEEGLKLINKFIQDTRPGPPLPSFWESVENCITNITCRLPTQKNITNRRKEESKKSNSQLVEPAHLLELMHRQLIGTSGTENGRGGNNWYSYRSVQELKTAGIKFRPNKMGTCVTDVRYEPLIIRAILRLPPMKIDDSTQSLLLNLAAYEMCPDSPDDFGVTSYIWFMDTLIDHADDVKELRKKGILLNYLGSDEEVAGLFNEIAKNLVPNSQAYVDVQDQIEKHYKNKVRLWMTEWLHTHFDTPWTTLAFLGAILAIVLSFIQTYIAINPITNSTNSGK